MQDPTKPDLPDQVDLTIEGDEDLSVRPWNGPAPRTDPSWADPASPVRENHHALIVNGEDLTVRPRRPAAGEPKATGVTPGPAGSQTE